MKSQIFACLVFCWIISSGSLLGQSGLFEGGFVAGVGLYTGDLDPDEFGEYVENLRPSLGLFFRYHVTNRINARVGFQYSKIVGDHAQRQDPRNLSFETDIYEGYLLGELDIFRFGYNEQRLNPYLLGGASYFRFNPRAEFNGGQVDLQPLGTEGQTLPGGAGLYNLNQIAVLGGAGVRFAVSEELTIAGEFIFRYTFTDYLDDVSTVYANPDDLSTMVGSVSAALADRSTVPRTAGSLRGNPGQKDHFGTVNITVSYNFHNLSLGGGRNQLGCPTF